MAVFFADLYVFDPATMTWTNLTNATRGPAPSARTSHGVTAYRGHLYVHGGNVNELPAGEISFGLDARSHFTPLLALQWCRNLSEPTIIHRSAAELRMASRRQPPMSCSPTMLLPPSGPTSPPGHPTRARRDASPRASRR